MPYEKTGKETRCIADEIPFEIPDSWEWVRLRSVVFNHGQKVPSQSFCYIDIGSIDNKKNVLNEKEHIVEANKAPSRARRIVALGDILYSTVRPYLHNMCIVDHQFTREIIASTGLAVFSCFTGLENNFLFRYLMSPDFDSYANSTDISKGIAYPAINDEKLYNALIPLPPLAEQKRIVAKIEALLPHLEEYDQAETRVEKLNAEFPEQLKKSILQWAIQGKLVPQDPNDEPASVLLDRIRAEKAKLVKAGKLKKDKTESVIFRRDNSHYEKLNGVERCIDDEIPFEIPDSWGWTRLGKIMMVKGGKRLPKGESFAPSTTPHVYIRVTDMKGNTLINNKLHYISDRVYEMIKSYTIGKDDLYLTIAGTIGEVGIVPKEFDGMNLTENAVKLTDIKIDKHFLLYSIMSPHVQNQFIDKTKIVAQPKLAIERIVTALLPVPPLAEQKRIVAEIEKILSLQRTMRR